MTLKKSIFDHVKIILSYICCILIHAYCILFFQNKELVLRVNMPLLAAPSHDCDAVLMDTPGFFEAVKDITKVAELSLESSCVYLFVMKYDQLRDTGDGEIFKKLLSSDKCKKNCTVNTNATVAKSGHELPKIFLQVGGIHSS